MGETLRELLQVREAGGGESTVVLAAAAVRIGRAPGNQVVLADTYASGSHAELVTQRGQRCVRDLGSTNGTWLNGKPIPPRALRPLHDGDVIQIGDSELTYRVQSVLSTNGTTAHSGDGTHVLGLPTPSMVQAAQARAGGSAAPAPAPWPVPTVAEPVRPARPRPGPAVGSGGNVAARAGRALLRALLVLLVLALLVAGVGWLLAPARLVLLVLGSDARPDEIARDQAGRTDTLLVVVADKAPGSVGMISIPRDLWVDIPGYGAERINTAYPVGGAKTAERAVGDLLGARVDRYLLIGLQGVRDVVDAAGGVDVDVTEPIHDDAYPTDDYGTVVVDIPAGRQHMDGETALRYARTRHQDNDFGRMARQQRVMSALRSQLLRPVNWWRIPGVLAAVRRATQTDLGPLDLLTVALALGTASDEPARLAIDLSLTVEFRGAGGAYLLRPGSGLRQRVATFLTPSKAAVEVLNGSSVAGLAKQTADRLQRDGWQIANVGDAGVAQAATVVEVQPGLRRAGQAIASTLGLPREAVRESPNLAEGIDARVTIGQQMAR
jgi:LCP family protein required for cell wall assembly